MPRSKGTINRSPLELAIREIVDGVIRERLTGSFGSSEEGFTYNNTGRSLGGKRGGSAKNPEKGQVKNPDDKRLKRNRETG